VLLPTFNIITLSHFDLIIKHIYVMKSYCWWWGIWFWSCWSSKIIYWRGESRNSLPLEKINIILSTFYLFEDWEGFIGAEILGIMQQNNYPFATYTKFRSRVKRKEKSAHFQMHIFMCLQFVKLSRICLIPLPSCHSSRSCGFELFLFSKLWGLVGFTAWFNCMRYNSLHCSKFCKLWQKLWKSPTSCS